MILGEKQRLVIGMIDGFDIDYYEKTPMPVMKEMAAHGFFTQGEAIFPTLTNANNISIACGAWPDEHGVTTNCYFDEATGTAQYLESPDFILAPTIFARAAQKGIKSALLTCKSKTTKIIGGQATLAIAAEEPTLDIVAKYGKPPIMYSSDINYWLWEVAIDILKNQPEIGVVYVHTTDYPMHMWAPEQSEAQEHMIRLDTLFGDVRDVAPDAAIMITADHGMNHKTRCWDLAKACDNRGFALKFAVSPVADRLLKHHRGFGGVSYVYLHAADQVSDAIDVLMSLRGVEDVLPREEAAARFRLMPDRIGDLVIIPDKDTVFGDLREEIEALAPDYRSHGSLYEMDIPLLIHNAQGDMPPAEVFRKNLDLTRMLYR
jgi:phosphonoacetate hydrolase